MTRSAQVEAAAKALLAQVRWVDELRSFVVHQEVELDALREALAPEPETRCACGECREERATGEKYPDMEPAPAGGTPEVKP